MVKSYAIMNQSYHPEISMQSRTFNRLSTVCVVILAIIVFVWMWRKTADVISVPTGPAEDSAVASSSVSQSATTSLETVFDGTVELPAASSTVSVSPTVTKVYSDPAENLPVTSIKTPKGVIHAMIAANDPERDQGLSGLPKLSSDAGMLFVFPDVGDYGFWMKNMNFPLDVVWISQDKTVAGVTAGLSPNTYPKVFFPPVKVMYVLELDSGGAATHGIATGTKLVF